MTYKRPRLLPASRETAFVGVVVRRHWNRERLYDLFASGPPSYPNGLPDEYDELAHMLNKGWISLRKVSYARTPEPPRQSPLYGSYEQAFRRGGRQHG